METLPATVRRIGPLGTFPPPAEADAIEANASRAALRTVQRRARLAGGTRRSQENSAFKSAAPLRSG